MGLVVGALAFITIHVPYVIRVVFREFVRIDFSRERALEEFQSSFEAQASSLGFLKSVKKHNFFMIRNFVKTFKKRPYY